MWPQMDGGNPRIAQMGEARRLAQKSRPTDKRAPPPIWPTYPSICAPLPFASIRGSSDLCQIGASAQYVACQERPGWNRADQIIISGSSAAAHTVGH